jgi:uncharacterized membrane protein
VAIVTSPAEHGRRAGRRLAHRVSTVARSRSARTELLVEHHRRFVDARGTLWFKPAVAVIVALGAGAALSQVQLTPDSPLWKLSFRASANDARQMLTVIIGALIPVTSLVFALTVVTLQIASTQFSPRLLRTFLRDRGTQVVLSAFVGTVAFSLACLFTIDTNPNDPNPRVPRLAISVALVLALICVGMLVYYFGHITNAVRIDTVMRQVEDDTRQTLWREHPLVTGDVDPDGVDAPVVPSHAVVLVAPVDGYVQGVDPRLAALAVRKRVTVRVLPLVGYYTVAGRHLATVWSDDGSPLKTTTMDAIAKLIEIDPERRVERDVGLGLRQLVDIVNRAMSTGQNDPYTATQAVHHLTSVLVDASRRSFATQAFREPDGPVRLVVAVMDFPTHLKVVCGHIRQGGIERHPRVMLEVIRMLGIIGEVVPTAARADAVRHEINVLLDDCGRMIHNHQDLDDVNRLGAEVLRRLDRGAEEPASTPAVNAVTA